MEMRMTLRKGWTGLEVEPAVFGEVLTGLGNGTLLNDANKTKIAGRRDE